MERLAVALLALWLAACAAPPVAPVAQPDRRFFNDHLFAAPSERVSATDVFALSEDMRRYLRVEIAEQARVKGPRQALVDALFSKGELKLEYDAEQTRNAAGAFAAREGNCLSLVIMTAAFARELELPIEYGKAIVDETWARTGDIDLLIGHVNLTLGRGSSDPHNPGVRAVAPARNDGATTIDFLPPSEARSVRTRPIREGMVVGMYMNNRAVEALAAGRIDDAYWWAREALVQAPELALAYNTLGAIYVRRGKIHEAERAFDHVLAVEPRNALALSNMIRVLTALGRNDDAQRLAERLDRLQVDTPFAHLQRGLAALQSGDARTARDEFAREVARDPYYHESQFWLGIAYLRTGEVEKARKHLALAMENSTTRRDREIYAAKLERMNSLR
jgi:tetratricopeptide (TPR) repeat protein